MDKRYHLLLVEDNPYVQQTLGRFLGAHYRVTIRPNGLEATEWLDQANLPDLIITDLEMPHLNGMDLIRLLRASTLYFWIPLVVLTDADDSQTRINCLELGADACISKPFNPSELLAKIRVLLRRMSRHDARFVY